MNRSFAYAALLLLSGMNFVASFHLSQRTTSRSDHSSVNGKSPFEPGIVSIKHFSGSRRNLFSSSCSQKYSFPRSLTARKRTTNDSRALVRLHESIGNNVPPRVGNNNVNPLVQEASRMLKRTSWFSWWAQTILTVISCTILLFASNATKANRAGNPPSFFLSALGLTVSFLSILWTWGNGTRLSRRLLRDKSVVPPQTSSAQEQRQQQRPPNSRQGQKSPFLPATPGELLRRAIRVQVSLNLVGLFLTLLAAEEIVGSLALKVLTAGSTFGNVYGAAAGATTPVGFVQPLDVLIVQANTNILLSHFASLTCSLYLADRVGLFQPQSQQKQQ